jgi:ribonucleoside-diphosphate reductase alpha chain
MTDLSKIKKRDGRLVGFAEQKISGAILKAMTAVGKPALAKRKAEAERLTKIVVNILRQAVNGQIPTVEQVQDIVEQVLMAGGHFDVARAYILYREKHKNVRKAKEFLGVKDDLDLSVNQLKVLESRFLRHDDYGRVLETPGELFRRVVRNIAMQEKKKQRKLWQKRFYQAISQMEFMPAGCYLRGAGTKSQMLANCFVLPVEDDMAAIFEAVKWLALVQQKGGGTGFNFSKLRPKGDYVKGSGGFATGPVSFMKVFDAATEQVMQGGFRQGANMGILNVDHPDILEFINSKAEDGEISNFNISVGASDKFMKAVKKNTLFELINPRTHHAVQTIKARELFTQIVGLAWRTGDPGMVFLDRINRDNPLLKTLGRIEATNVCGEQPLHSFDVCNLGSINLSRFVGPAKTINWERLREVVKLGVRFLDDGVDASRYPLPQIAKMAKANRRIGLGVMGWADLLYQLGIAYNSETGVNLAEKVMGFINQTAVTESKNLAKEKGVFKTWKGSTFEKKGIRRRNLGVTTIAPTGTISMVAGCSSGIEPVFGLVYVKDVVDESGLSYVNRYFQAALETTGLSEEQKELVYREVARTGSCQTIKILPKELRQVFVVAHDISPEWHVRMQAAWQKHTENAVSKTVNFPKTATIEAVEKAYLLAWELGCKGITIYRSGSKETQVLRKGSDPAARGTVTIQSKLHLEPLPLRKSNRCPECGQRLEFSEGCASCPECGYTHCSL